MVCLLRSCINFDCVFPGDSFGSSDGDYEGSTFTHHPQASPGCHHQLPWVVGLGEWNLEGRQEGRRMVRLGEAVSPIAEPLQYSLQDLQAKCFCCELCSFPCGQMEA